MILVAFPSHLTLSVGHSDDENVIERIDTVNLGQQLIDDRVVNASAVAAATANLADGVDLEK